MQYLQKEHDEKGRMSSAPASPDRWMKQKVAAMMKRQRTYYKICCFAR
ncbi:unnamed protein product [Amoebophrya sp. A25]|nr:unnamed protein product [Amoebophrya sp. A25]|eukprot:GSA25T00026067001.1